MFKKILILSVSFLLLGGFVLADTVEPQDFTYLFHLYYDNGQLFADRDAQFKYDVLPEKFVAESLTSSFYYKGEIINLKSEVAQTFQFDPRQGNLNFSKGVLSVKAPYVPDGQKAIFYNNQGDALLTVFVSESSFCNDDGACNSDVGEDSKTCPNDCKEATPIPTVITEAPGGGQGGMLMIVIYVLIIAVAGLSGWFGWKWWQKRKQYSGVEIPSNLPPTPSNPQNPNVQ